MKNLSFLRKKYILFTLLIIACFFPSQTVSGYAIIESPIQDRFGETNDFIIDFTFSSYSKLSSFYLINNYANGAPMAHSYATIGMFPYPFIFSIDLISFDLVPNQGLFNYCVDISNL